MSKRDEADPADIERRAAATPESLRRALRALRDESPSGALLQRVETRLSQRMEVAHVGRSEWLLRSVTQSAWILSGLSVIVMSGSLAAFLWHAGQARDAQVVARERSVATLPVARERGPADSRSQPVERAALPRMNAQPRTHEERASEARARVAEEKARRLTPAALHVTQQTRAAATAESRAPEKRTTQTTTTPTERAAASDPLVAPHDESAPSRREVASPPSASEVDLLLRARALAAQDPEAALALLVDIAKRFPAGLLAPERQLLRIEVLRALGRSREADAQLRAFQQQYPNSPHLRRLVAGGAVSGH